MSPVALDPLPFPKRWPWLMLGLAIGVAALSVLAFLHQREQTARRAESQATRFASELRDSVREITIFGDTVPDRDVARALRPVVRATAATAGARLERLETTLGGDPRIDDLRRQIAEVRRIAQTERSPTRYGERLTAIANRTAATADAITSDQRDRATLMAREAIAGGALAMLAGMGLIALVLQHVHRLLVRAGRRQARQFRELALRDPLTGLGNRRRLADDLARLAPRVHDHAPVQVTICDLDGFKALNDTLGHEAGDALLVAFADRLRTATGDTGHVYRLGGDEFCVLSLPGHDLTPRLHRALAGDQVHGSAGTALWPTEGPSARAAMRLADERMYAAKDARRASAA